MPSDCPLIIDGKDVTTDLTFDIPSPVDNKVLYKCSSASISHANAALASSKAAFASWSKLNYAARRDFLLKAASCMEARRDEAWKYQREETGAPEMMFNITFGTGVSLMRDIAGRLSTIEGSAPTLAGEGSSAIVYKEPYGVVLGIAPW